MHFNFSYAEYIFSLLAAGDGVFSTIREGVVQLVDLKTNTSRDLVKLTDVHDVRRMLFDSLICV